MFDNFPAEKMDLKASIRKIAKQVEKSRELLEAESQLQAHRDRLAEIAAEIQRFYKMSQEEPGRYHFIEQTVLQLDRDRVGLQEAMVPIRQKVLHLRVHEFGAKVREALRPLTAKAAAEAHDAAIRLKASLETLDHVQHAIRQAGGEGISWVPPQTDLDITISQCAKLAGK